MPRPLKLKKPSVYPDSQSGKYIADFHEIVDGERRQRRLKFPSKKKAQAKADEIEVKQKRLLNGKTGTLTSAQVQLAQWLFTEIDALPWKGVTTYDIVDYFKKNYRGGDSMTLKAAIAEFLDYKRKSLAKDSSYKDLPPRLKKFLDRYPDAKVGELTTEEVLAHVDAQAEGMKYKIYSLLREFLNYMSNPGRTKQEVDPKLVNELEFKTEKGKHFKIVSHAAPTILHIEEVKKALKVALTFKVGEQAPGSWLGSFVLGVYCGLRPHEIQALGRIQRGDPPVRGKSGRYTTPTRQSVAKGARAVWERHVQLNRGVIICDENITTKTGERRNVTIRPNVREWLEFVKEKRLPLCPSDRKWERSQKDFKIRIMGEERQKNKLWDDVYRHTFATFLFHLNDMTEGQYTKQLGHSMQVATDYYLGDMYDYETSEEFFSFRPSDAWFRK